MTTTSIRLSVASRHPKMLLPRATGMIAVAAVCLSSPTLASGFLTNIQGAGPASVSLAGQTALAEEASTLYYNPAGITQLSRPELLLSPGIVFTSTTFENGGTTNAAGQLNSGSTDIDNQVFLIPSLYATLPISNRLSVGLGLFTPFGQETDYDPHWVGRYHSQRTSLLTVDIDPVVAYRINDTFSIGAGIDIQYAHLERNNAIDFGSLCFAIVDPSTCLMSGLLPGSVDGQLSVDVSNWSVGYNFGVLYHVGDTTHIGLSYRSSVTHDFSGEAAFDVPAPALPLTQGGLLFQDTNARASITFPDVIAVGLSQRIGSRFTLLVDFNRTLWSHMDQVTLDFGNPLQPDQRLVFNWDDSNYFALGGIYQVTNDTDIRGGLAYDESPVPEEFRGSDIPDSDRLMFSAGFAHRFGDRFSTKFSYSYGHYEAAPVNVSVVGAGTLAGTFERRVHALAVNARITF